MRQPDFTQEQPLARRPHHVAPHFASVRLLMVEHRQQPSSAGGIAMMVDGTARVLRRAGVHVDSWAVSDIDDLMNKLTREKYDTDRPFTHVVLNTPNFPPEKIAECADLWREMEFIQLNHSGLAYLDLDGNGHGIGRIRQVMDLQMARHNIRVAGTNVRFIDMAYDAYGHEALLLPNLYYWENLPHPVSRADRDPLRIGSFGIGRDWKNQSVAAMAALSIARSMGVFLELHVNTDPWGNYKRVRDGRRHLFADMPNAKLVEHEWAAWPNFRRLVSSMDLLISPSFDETFCRVCADGIVEGVPTVGTDAMEWLPDAWRCRHPHDQASIAATGKMLLHDRNGAVHKGRAALDRYVREGTQLWIEYLTR